MRVVVAPDKFRGSLTASEAAEAIADGVRDADPSADVATVPVADGGEGTIEAALSAGYRRIDHDVTGPTGEQVTAAVALSPDGGTAVVELAAASGLSLLDEPAPLTASTRGTGELVRHALDAGARTVVLAVGGSAGTDGGAGLLAALGARALDAEGSELGDGGAALRGISRLDLDGLDPRLSPAGVVLACDVDNPLLGPRGAAAVFGPQKGATPDDVRLLDEALQRWADAVEAATGADHRDVPGAGAAGGAGIAALGVLGARAVPGVDVVLDLVDFDDRLLGADLVITGEGSFDAQSLAGKAPVGVALRARAAGVPAVVLAGRLDGVDDAALRSVGIEAAHDLSEVCDDPDRRMSDAAELLRRLAAWVVSARLPR
ncbi:MAG TPA: glycerate kinase [Actinomycetales bacterium]|nr:glycerate kinase [Actinomycetales bacterium]